MFADALAWAQTQAVGSRARALSDAYASGTRRVQFDGRTIEYASTAEIERTLSALHQAASSAASRRPASTIAVIGSGF